VIEVEIEVEAWTEALPDVESLVVRTAEATLRALATPPPRGRDRREAVGDAAIVDILYTPQPAHPFPQGGGDVTILLADDRAVKTLNARFRGKDVATNVLSFPAPASARPHLGDVVLAYGVCEREAAAQAKRLADHLTHLTAHGVLHLLGYDHETDADAEVMEGLERSILADLGIDDPYADDHVF
jgi:probable rRNA maturation factor